MADAKSDYAVQAWKSDNHCTKRSERKAGAGGPTAVSDLRRDARTGPDAAQPACEEHSARRCEGNLRGPRISSKGGEHRKGNQTTAPQGVQRTEQGA